MPNFRCEKGATLVELLAALVLFSFVGAVAYTFLINSFLFQERSEERVNLVQESNLLAAELSSLHDKGAIIYLDNGGVLYEGNSNDGRELLAQNVTTERFTYNSQVLEMGNALDLNGERYEFNSELQSGGYTHTLQFTSNNVGAYTYIAEEETVGGNEGGEEEPPAAPEDINFPDENELGEDRSFSSSECIFYGNTNHGGSLIAPWKTCVYNENIDGNLYFNRADTEINSGEEVYLTVTNGGLFTAGNLIMVGRPELKVDHMLFTGGNTTLQSNSKAAIGGASVINGALTMQENALLQTASLNTSGNLQMNASSRIETSGNSSIEGEFRMQETALLQTDALTVSGLSNLNGSPQLNIATDAVFANGLQTNNSPLITIGGNITVNGPVRLQSGGSSQMIEIGGNAFFEGNLNYQQTANLAVTGDMLVTGNIGNEISWDAGRLCVQGDLQVNGQILEPIRVNTSASSCEGLPAREIRVLGNFIE